MAKHQDASDPRIREDGCGKACFKSERAAILAFRRQHDRGRHQGWKGRVHAYQCEHCGYLWHYGHRSE